ncbi:type II secretion system protein [bacterium]|nr:type II secretion system protein [bacterium]
MKQKKETHAQSHCERSVAIARLSNRTDDAITTQTSFARNDKRSTFTLAEGATHVGTCDNVRKNAFTLAEVLITLAIIGVVAAMTIPTLVSNYKKQVIETRLAKFYSTVNQAIKLSETDNGSLTTWDALELDKSIDSNGNQVNRTTNMLEWYNKYFSSYLKTAKIEKPENDRDGQILVYFHDGSMVGISAGSWIYYPFANDYSSSEFNDDGITDRDRTVCGSKYFTFLFNPQNGYNNPTYSCHNGKYLEPYVDCSWDGTREQLMNHSVLGCSEKDVRDERAYCTKLIQLNNWKIPDDYPFKF